MAPSNVLSAGLTARNAGNTNMDYFYNAAMQIRQATVEATSGDETLSVYRLIPIKAGEALVKLDIATDALGSGITLDIGLYKKAADGGAVVDLDCFASSVAVSNALAFTEVTYEATATNISKVEKRVWELAGISADPGNVEYDICATVNGTPATGTISMRAQVAT